MATLNNFKLHEEPSDNIEDLLEDFKYIKSNNLRRFKRAHFNKKHIKMGHHYKKIKKINYPVKTKG